MVIFFSGIIKTCMQFAFLQRFCQLLAPMIEKTKMKMSISSVPKITQNLYIKGIIIAEYNSQIILIRCQNE